MANTKGKGDPERPVRPRRWSANRKVELVLRLLRGESLDAVSRESGLPASVLSEGRESFIETGRAGLKSRTTDPVTEAAAADEPRRLLAKIGELSMQVEVLEVAKQVLEEKLGPSEPRRSKK